MRARSVQVLPPATAFLCLTNLLALRFFPPFLQMNLEQIELRWRTFEILLGQECPYLACHLDQVGFTSDLFITDWWLTLFSKDFPIEIAARVWDCFLLEGEPYLFKAAIGVCKHVEPQLLGQPMEVCHGVIGKVGKAITPDAFFAAAASVGVSANFIREMLRPSTA